METSQIEFKELAINADRFCESISKIGYKPHAAIMDIVDNSVSAGANEILIELRLKSGSQPTAAGSIESINIYDNGMGMSAAEIETALEIGAETVYAENSLSKFGMGLKSAGFSLGRHIAVMSKAKPNDFNARFVDRDVIKKLNAYGVCVSTASEPEWLQGLKHGTLVSISKTPDRQDSAVKCARDLRSKLGVTYQFFLSSSMDPLNIRLQIGSREPELIEAKDPLHLSDAVLGFDSDNYDATRPCSVFSGPIGNDLFGNEAIQVDMAIFPMDKMKGFPGFTEEERRRVASFEIKRENSGFYFYRNNRLIRWADKLAGAARDDINFRAQIRFSTVHDDYFHVDVSKQNLELNEEFDVNLRLLCRAPLKAAEEALKRCKDLLDMGTGAEGESFNERTETFAEEDPTEIIDSAPAEVKNSRKRLKEQLTQVQEALEESSVEDTSVADELPEPVVFQRVRYSDKMLSLDLAQAGYDSINGTYVRINRNHPFYHIVLARFEPQSVERMALEALLWASAVAESKTFENAKLEPSQITLVLDHLRQVFSVTTNAWALNNQDVF